MEKRFTLKDFFLFSAIGAVLVALLVAMYMVDRQWNMMARMRATMQEQAQDLRALRSDLKTLDRRVESGALADYTHGDWLVRAFGVGLSTITPLISQDVYASNVQSYVQESLLSRNPDTLEWEGLIARSWEKRSRVGGTGRTKSGGECLTIVFRVVNVRATAPTTV